MHLFAMQLGMALVGLLFKIIILLVAVGLTLKIYCECTKGKYRGSQGMAGKTVIITGGNSGIGKETAKELARRKARVIIACRNIEKARKAAREIFEDTEQQVTIKPLDLQSFKSIREFANDIINTEPRLDVLINNAGMANESRNPDLTEDGCEPCFQANYLGHFLLTVLLAGLLRKSAPSRVVNVSSVLHLVGSVDHLEQKMLGATRPHRSLMVYADSKLAQVVFTRTLARKLKRDGVTVNVLQPGTVKTDILKPGNSIIGLTIFIMAVLFGKTPSEGAQTSVYAAVDPGLLHVTGQYFADCGKALLGPKHVEEEHEEDLFRITAKVVGLRNSELALISGK